MSTKEGEILEAAVKELLDKVGFQDAVVILRNENSDGGFTFRMASASTGDDGFSDALAATLGHLLEDDFICGTCGDVHDAEIEDEHEAVPNAMRH